MITILWKEINSFFSSLIAYIAIGIFLVFLSLMLWIFPDNSILEYPYASLDGLFTLAPMIFLFLIPAITMRSFSEEIQNGTIELLVTKPISIWEIILGKYFAAVLLIIISIIPTFIYYISVYLLGSPPGNLDTGAIIGSYIGLIFLGASFASIGIFTSCFSKNQIVAFISATFLCFIFYWAFLYISKLPFIVGKIDDVILKFGIDNHYQSLSRGVIDTRDIVYFLSLIFFFLYSTKFWFQKNMN